MPKGRGVSDKVSDYVAEVVILEEIIKLNIQKIFYERNKLERYIAEIPDSEVRLIMRLRHINGMTWDEIGAEVNQERTTVAKKYRRFINNSHNSRSKNDIV